MRPMLGSDSIVAVILLCLANDDARPIPVLFIGARCSCYSMRPGVSTENRHLCPACRSERGGSLPGTLFSY